MGTARTGIDYDALVKDDRVHGRVYTDPAIFEEEMDKIFSRGWVYVGHASEIPQLEDFRVTTIGRQSVIMVRDDEGQVRLLMNRCTHRANAVCQVERVVFQFGSCSLSCRAAALDNAEGRLSRLHCTVRVFARRSIGAAHPVEIDRETTMSAPTAFVCVPTREKLAAPTKFEWEKTL